MKNEAYGIPEKLTSNLLVIYTPKESIAEMNFFSDCGLPNPA